MRTITAGLVTRLTGDATLTALAPGGAWLDIAPATATRPVVIVALQRAPLDEDMCGGTVVRRFSFLVAVEGEQDQVVSVRNAAARIEDLLHRTAWSATGWHIGRSAFVDVNERAYVDGEARRCAVIGQLEVVAERA